MNWASLVKGGKKKEKIKTKSKDSQNYKKLNTLSFCKKKENEPKIDKDSDKDIIENNVINTLNNSLDLNLLDDFTDNLYNNYQKFTFKEYNQLSYLNSCDTYHFFMNYSKPILFDSNLNYNSESEYYSE